MDINLLNGSSARHDKSKDGVNCDGLNHRAEGISKVDARHLIETFSNKAGFVAINRAIRLVFEFKNPFTAHNIHGRMRRNQGSSAIT